MTFLTVCTLLTSLILLTQLVSDTIDNADIFYSTDPDNIADNAINTGYIDEITDTADTAESDDIGEVA